MKGKHWKKNKTDDCAYVSDEARLSYWRHANAKDTRFLNPGHILILGLGPKHRAPWPLFIFEDNFFKRCVREMVHVSYHLWTLISWSPTWCLPRLPRCHCLPFFSWLSADQAHSSWLVSLHPCSVPVHSTWLQGFCQCSSCLRGKTPGAPEALLLHLCGHGLYSQSLDGRLVNGFLMRFPGGLLNDIPWVAVLSITLLNDLLNDHTS